MFARSPSLRVSAYLSELVYFSEGQVILTYNGARCRQIIRYRYLNGMVRAWTDIAVSPHNDRCHDNTLLIASGIITFEGERSSWAQLWLFPRWCFTQLLDSRHSRPHGWTLPCFYGNRCRSLRHPDFMGRLNKSSSPGVNFLIDYAKYIGKS